jgi:hypothetical protein
VDTLHQQFMLFEYVSPPTEPSEMLPDTACVDGEHGQCPPHVKFVHGGWYVPAAQLVHAKLPMTVLYFPAAHTLHAPPSDPVKPILQSQLLDLTTDCELLGQLLQVATAVAPVAAEYVLALQSVQPALPEFALYLPTPHAAHAPPSGPEKPATHTQSVGASLPCTACE